MSIKGRDHTLKFYNDGVDIVQKGWGRLFYNLEDLENEIRAIQKAGKGTISKEDAENRIYVLRAAQEALIGR